VTAKVRCVLYDDPYIESDATGGSHEAERFGAA
jgi:hypothetical protein